MSKKQTYYSIRSFLSYMSHYKLRFAFVLVWYVIANVFLAIIPVFVGKLTGVLATSPVDHDLALRYAWILVVCSVGHTLSWHVSELFYLKFLQPIGFAYESMVYRQVIGKKYHFFVDKFTGKVAAYVGMLGDEMRGFITNLLYNYTSEVVRLVTISAVLFSVNRPTGLIFVGGLMLMFLVGKKTVQNSVRYEKKSADAYSTKTGKLVDSIANFVNIKSFQKENQEASAIEAVIDKTRVASRKSSLWNMFFWGSMGVVVRAIIWPGTILFNTHLFLNGGLTIAEFTTFMTCILLFSDFVWGVIWNVSQFNLKLARIEEAHQYLFGKINLTKNFAAQQQKPNRTLNFKKKLEIKNLTFAYPDKHDAPVLSDVTLSIKKGEKIGVVGKSGSGKTTLIKLLIGYYDAPASQLFLDNEPVRTDDLSKLIAYVPQDTALFHRTIAENIAYATDRQVSREDVVIASKQAHADEFISQIDSGYDAMVGERGVKLSAGQRQRIAIARAFLDDKPILILDEATSALDSESEILVQSALEDLWTGKTVIAIAHRLSTLRNMDRIVVMGKSGIIEQGTHEDLLKKKGAYAKLWSHQSGGFLED